MFDETIIARWVEERSSVALKKLLNNEPLSFEDNMIFALVGQREELQRVSKRLEERIDGVEKRIDGVEKRITEVENNFEKRIDSVEKRIDGVEHSLEKRIDGVEKRIERLESEVVLLRKEMIAIRQDINTLTRWILTAIVGLPVLMKLLDLLVARL